MYSVTVHLLIYLERLIYMNQNLTINSFKKTKTEFTQNRNQASDGLEKFDISPLYLMTNEVRAQSNCS